MTHVFIQYEIPGTPIQYAAYWNRAAAHTILNIKLSIMIYHIYILVQPIYCNIFSKDIHINHDYYSVLSWYKYYSVNRKQQCYKYYDTHAL